MGVMPFLGELQDNLGGMRGNMAAPRRLEADDVTVEETEQGQRFVLDVHSLTNYEFTKGSFMEYMADKAERPSIVGQILLTLDKDRPVLRLSYRLRWQALTGSGYVAIRGPWLLAGADSYGIEKTDAIFPGVEWLRKDEWSSNRNYMTYPLAERTAPHPFKVSAPLMAVSHEGDVIALSWDPAKPLIARRPQRVDYYAQPVFSSPDAVNHANQHLMGLMLPSAVLSGAENKPFPETLTPVSYMSEITLEAEISLAKGASLDAYTDWVKRHGLPTPPEPRYPLEEALHYIASCYNSNLWFEKGWGIRLERDIARGGDLDDSEMGFAYPVHMQRYVTQYADTQLGRELASKLEIAKQQPSFLRTRKDPQCLLALTEEAQRLHGDNLLDIQHEDGSFRFEPENPKSPTFMQEGINHTPFARNLYMPLGVPGDTALEQNVVCATELLLLAEALHDQSLTQAACRALDFCLDTLVPDGGDVWETPLHSPNILATGHAAIAYELAYRQTGNQAYRSKAIYFLRGNLVFTHLWEPRGVKDLYCTKPCFCATDWATTSWVNTHVEWEVIQTLAIAHEMGIDWAQVDPDIDWHRYEEGICCAVTHWLLDASRADELPLDIDLALGHLNGLFADAHDPVTGECHGWQLFPDYLSNLLMDVLDYQKK
jgi:hypothetical protein